MTDLESGGSATYRGGQYIDKGEWGTPSLPITAGGAGLFDDLDNVFKDYWNTTDWNDNELSV